MTSHSNLPPTCASMLAPGEVAMAQATFPFWKLTPCGTGFPCGLSGGATSRRLARSA